MTSPVQEGDVLIQKYRVERVLGEGGMGIVVAATHLDLDQKVALKFLLPAALAHPEIVERFAREARAVAKIRSQHVVRVIDTGKMESGTPFMVMEYLEGKDLCDLLAAGGRLPIATAVDYLLQACEAMAEAHAVGIVHRDLKPANLFLANQPDRRAIIKVLDFGISKVVDPKSAQLTRTATMMGSPHYMSPEQLTSTKHVDARSDIWALGVILYELVTGVRPFDADSMPEIVARILSNTPVRPCDLRPDLPAALEVAILRCLASSPDYRFASVDAFAATLSPFASEPLRAEAAVSRMARVLGPSTPPPAMPGAGGDQARLDRGAAASTGTAHRVVNAGAEPDAAHSQTQMASSPATGGQAASPVVRRGGRVAIAGAALIMTGVGIALLLSRGHATPDAGATSRAASAEFPAFAAPPAQPSSLPVEPPATSAAAASPAPPVPHASAAVAPARAPTRRVAAPAPSTNPATSARPSDKSPLNMGIK